MNETISKKAKEGMDFAVNYVRKENYKRRNLDDVFAELGLKDTRDIFLLLQYMQENHPKVYKQLNI